MEIGDTSGKQAIGEVCCLCGDDLRQESDEKSLALPDWSGEKEAGAPGGSLWKPRLR